MLLQTRDLGFASPGGPLRFTKHLWLVLSSAAVASSPSFFPNASCLCYYFWQPFHLFCGLGFLALLLVQWNMGLVFYFFPLFVVILANCQKAEKKKMPALLYHPQTQNSTIMLKEYFIQDRKLNVSLYSWKIEVCFPYYFT